MNKYTRKEVVMKRNVTKEAQVHGVGEWAKYSVNIQDGCEHDCRYCYAKGMAVRFGRMTPTSWSTPRLREEAKGRNYRKRNGRIMFPTSHDITPENVTGCLVVLRKMLASGNDVLIVSKPHPSCVEQICEALGGYWKQIVFRFTIGSACESTLRYWEPNAPSFSDRLAALKIAHRSGFATSISCEPMLDTNIAAVIAATKPFVTDAIWLGRANNLRAAMSLNCPGDAEAKRMADALLAEQTDEYLRDLYERYKAYRMIKFKDSIKKVVGLDRPVERGLDV